MSSTQGGTSESVAETAAIVVASVVILAKIVVLIIVCNKRAASRKSDYANNASDSKFLTLTMHKFLNDMEREQPIKFTSQQLRIATDNYSHLLGSGGFGTVYKGIFSNGTMVAVKVLYGNSDNRIKEQFMAEVSTIGRVHHFNLVRLYGFCFEKNLRALVYEYMGNGSLDKYLFGKQQILGFEKLHNIAIGTAKGIAYLHEECQQRIIHYDIKPGNILLDFNFNPKVADFGLAKLSNRDNTHVTMTGGRGTPGYAAPELWLPFPITHKCDVYSFGMLLFEIIGRRRNLDTNLQESQEWFPKWIWNKFEAASELRELMIVCGIEQQNWEIAERMVKVALWCIQHNSQLRPAMSVVVKMLEGSFQIPRPSNPYDYYMMNIGASVLPTNEAPQSISTLPNSDTSTSQATTTGSLVPGTPIMRRYEIQLAST